VSDQYRNWGLTFEGTAVLDISGVKSWAPIAYSWSVGRISPFAYDFRNLLPIRLTSMMNPSLLSSSVSVEFMNVPAGAGELVVTDLTGVVAAPGAVIRVATNGGVGPHGGTVATVTLPPYFDGLQLNVERTPPGDTGPWGVSQLTIEAPSTAAAPEPGTLVLAAIGGAGLAGCGWAAAARRRN
jgi:hypothetical protein